MSSDEEMEMETETFIDINNIFCSFNVRCKLNLEDIMNRSINVEMKKNRNYINMQLREPQSTAKIWPSGKIVCMGTKSEADAKIASRRFARILQKLGYPCRFTNFKVSNCHATILLPFTIKIVDFSKAHPEASYEPELHAGVIYKVEELKATVTIHRTGRLVILAPSENSVKQAVEEVYPLVEPFQTILSKKKKAGKYHTMVFRSGSQQKRTPENFRQRLLPYNWKKESIRRESGKFKGRWDNYLCTPNGERLRSEVEFVNFLRKNPDVQCDREVTFVYKHL